ncbi:MAG: 3-methylcrotonyl-CoA carboxylase, partial [Chloroflexi bacterium]|nr:3-methylcrotonyl-CoA carboxylase [Chloroflexota bacterium]
MAKVLIANRGEIACRIIQACHELGHVALAIHVEADEVAKHVQLADQAVSVESYLSIEGVIEAARRAGADAIHPGYGFLSENPALADACEDAGIVWAGPKPGSIRLMGDKLAAKRLAADAGVPLVPGSETEDPTETGFPLLIKAAAGGGGKGMRSVERPEDFAEALEGAKREAKAAFGDERVFLERLVVKGRHVEVQIFGDAYGRVVALGERDCSMQRRYQKVVEESPAPNLSAATRERLHEAAVRLGQVAHYQGPGTAEFLVEGEAFYFLEMNTRLQVEHPVTELVTGLDLAKLQLRIAFGEPLPADLSTELRGHAIEARVYAEDADAGFLPATGRILRLELPHGPGIRNDVGIQLGDEIGINFDPLLAKLIVWGADRAEALARMQDALRRYCILGVTTNLPFLLKLVSAPDFAAADLSTRFIPDHSNLTVAEHAADLEQARAAWQSLRISADPFRHGWRPAASAHRTPDGGLMLDGRRYYVAESEDAMEVWRAGQRAVFP